MVAKPHYRSTFSIQNEMIDHLPSSYCVVVVVVLVNGFPLCICVLLTILKLIYAHTDAHLSEMLNDRNIKAKIFLYKSHNNKYSTKKDPTYIRNLITPYIINLQ